MKILSAIPHGVLVVDDKTGKIVEHNEKYKGLFPLVSTSIDPGYHFDELIIDAQTAGQNVDTSETWVDDRLAFLRLKNRDNNTFLHEFVGGGVVRVDEQRSNDVIISTYTDITQETNLTTSLQEAQRKLLLSQESTGELLSNLSHELLTPLNGIMGFSELIKSIGYSEEYIDNVLTSSEFLLRHIDNMLNTASINQKNLDLDKTWVDLSSLFNLGSINQALADKKNITIALSSDINSSLSIFADMNYMYQAVQEIIHNALSFSDENSKIDVLVKIDKGRNMIILIKDYGCGMEQSILDNIKLAFTQADSSFTKDHQGLGNGVFFSNTVIEHHGYSLEYDSAVGVGTTAAICIPVGSNELIR